MKNISAHTETVGTYAPGYVNISEDEDGSMVVTVRTSGAQTSSFVRLSREELSDLCKPCVIADVVDEQPTPKAGKK